VKIQDSPLNGPDGLHLTPIGNADRFLRDHGENLRWVEGRGNAGTFFWWDGLRWQEDNPQATELAQQTVRDLRKLVEMATKNNCDPREVEQYLTFWKNSEAAYKVGEILILARSRIVVDRGAFDADPDILGVENGLLDLRDGTFRAPVREDMLTKQCNVVFDETAQCPQWDKFLVETTQNDPELIRYLRQCAGIFLTGHQREHLFFVIVGPGSTGKTTYCETLTFVLGDYSCGVDPNTLAMGKAEGGRARPDIAKLPGMRLVLANESRAGLKLDEGLVKSLTGGDTWTGRMLFENEFDFKPMFKLVIRTNAEPQFDGSDSGMQRRIKKIPFVHIITEQAKDASLQEKLKNEAAGILNWALTGLQDYQKNGLIEPGIVRKVTAEYIASLDIIGQFISERCEVGAGFKVGAQELYTEFVMWSTARGPHLPVGDKRFSSDLGSRNFAYKHTNKGKVWIGIKIAAIGRFADDANEPTLAA
jgi:putative DNA primase/helicase